MLTRQREKLGLFLAIVFLSFSFAGCASTRTFPSYTHPSGIYHIVGKGETLYRIAKTYHVSMEEIARANNIRNPNQIDVGDRLFISRAYQPRVVTPYRPLDLSSTEKLVGKKKYKIKWRYITIHHSATREGNAKVFNRYHRKRRMGGLAYHFVIGNGRGSGNGEIEVGWRWSRQIESCRRKDIQICLVGNFDRQRVSTRQFASLVKLINVLRKQYNIPLKNIRRHKNASRKATNCPGKNFPFYKLLSELKKSKP